jgi:putative transposase
VSPSLSGNRSGCPNGGQLPDASTRARGLDDGADRAARAGVSRKSPRFIPPGSLVEITARTVGRRYLLRPSEELNAGILAILGRALALCAIDLHAIAFMSNHWHGLASVRDAEALSRFVQHLHSNLARLVHRLHGWDGSVFGKAAFIVVGAAAEEDRLRYVLSQGVKEGLVRRCVDWPGVHCARALLLREVLVGRWRDRRREHRIRAGGGRGGGRAPAPGEVETTYPIVFAPLPTWAGVPATEQLRRVRRIIDDIEASGRAQHETVLGVERVQTRDPFAKPTEWRSGHAPAVHTNDEDERSRFTMEELSFAESYDRGRHRLRKGWPAQLPAGCFPPIAPFRRAPSLIWSFE